MQLILDQSLAAGYIPVYTWQQRASDLPFKLSVLERKVYNNDEKTLFSLLMFAKPECENVLQPEPLCSPNRKAVQAKTHDHTRA